MIFLTALGMSLALGFYGSWHCGAMCGPITMNFRRTKDFWLMQAARLISYLMMTALVYFLARWVQSSVFESVRWISSVLMGLVLIGMGVYQWRRGRPTPDFLHFLMKRFSFKTQKKIFSHSYLVGFLMGFFPCGWFYSFLFVTPQMPHFYQAVLVMIVFWSTSLPALMVFRGLILKVVQESPLRYQRAASVVLVVAGLLSILGQWSHALMFQF